MIQPPRAHLRKDGNWESAGWVEQVNDYGNRIHRDWRCVLRYAGNDKWDVVYLHVGKFTKGVYVPE